MTNVRNDPILQMETACGTLLHELQVIALLFSDVYLIPVSSNFLSNLRPLLVISIG